MNPVHLALGAAIVALAIIGLCWVLARVADGLERAWDWLEWRFRGDDGDDYTDDDSGNAPHPYCVLHDQPLDWCDPPHDDPLADLLPLPPERSREELGFTGPQPARRPGLPPPGLSAHTPQHGPSSRAYLADPGTGYLTAPRERRPPWWEAEHRAAYESLGFDFPSGLMARIREYTVN